MGHVRDLWTDPPGAGGTKRQRNARWGHGKRWLARWIVDGSEHAKAFATRDEADAWVRERDSGRPIAKPVSTMTVAKLAERWQAAQVQHRASTRGTEAMTIKRMILPTLGDRRVAELDRATLQGAVTVWAEGWSASRVHVAWSHLVGMLTMAVDDGIIEARPSGVRVPRVIQAAIVPLTPEQVAAIADRVPERWRSMVIVGAGTGMRSGEMRGLTWDRVSEDTIMVDRQLIDTSGRDPIFGPPKSEASRRRIAIGPSVVEALRQQRERWPSEDLVWRTRVGTPMDRTCASGVWRAATDGMGLRERSGWHELRHHHASLLIAAGLSPRAVADRLGHADVTETLRTYAHLWSTDESRAVAVIESTLRGSGLGIPDGAQTEQDSSD